MLRDTTHRYRVHVGYTATGRDRWRYFAALKDAQRYCSTVFARTRVVLTIMSGGSSPC